MKTKDLIRFGRITALVSFLLGTILFVRYYQTSDSTLLFVGYGFILFIGTLNLGILAAIVVKAIKNQSNRKRLLNTGALMTINIPIVVIYCWVTIILLNTMRITFTNQMDTEVSDITIFGCSEGYIDKLAVGESETVWIDITGDCSIHINYSSNGQRKVETVAGYVTSSMGQKVNYNIGGKNRGIF